MITYSGKIIYIIGHVLTPDYKEPVQTIKIQDGRIVQIMLGINKPDDPSATVITLKDTEVIIPAFSNLHTHIGYNILPIWENGKIWKNRYQWRANSDYSTDIKALLKYIETNWSKDSSPGFINILLDIVRDTEQKLEPETEFMAKELMDRAISEVQKAHTITSEIQAVSGGTSIIQQSISLDDDPPAQRTFVIRNTANPVDIGLADKQKIFSVIDFFRPDVKPTGDPNEDTSNWKPVPQEDYSSYIKSVNNGNDIYYSTLIHAAEGKSGYFKKDLPDPYSQLEAAKIIESLKTDVKNPANLRASFLSITHGCGISSNNKSQMNFLRDNGIGLVWSPVSNFLLYFDTVNIPKLLDAGINICLGSDWSPSGSKHVFDELRFAKYLNDLFSWGISDIELFKMVTSNPTNLIGINNYGEIKEGANADLFILNKTDPGTSAIQNIFRGSDKDISFVMVNGRIVFGLIDYFRELGVDFDSFPATEGSEVAQRGVSFNKAIQFDLVKSLNIMDTLMTKYLDSIGKPHLQRTRFLASDDAVYINNIQHLKERIQAVK
jgi:5-methylthioadenosine/S-adenosylhomocysteine deaminase